MTAFSGAPMPGFLPAASTDTTCQAPSSLFKSALTSSSAAFPAAARSHPRIAILHFIDHPSAASICNLQFSFCNLQFRSVQLELRLRQHQVAERDHPAVGGQV